MALTDFVNQANNDMRVYRAVYQHFRTHDPNMRRASEHEATTAFGRAWREYPAREELCRTYLIAHPNADQTDTVLDNQGRAAPAQARAPGSESFRKGMLAVTAGGLLYFLAGSTEFRPENSRAKDLLQTAAAAAVLAGIAGIIIKNIDRR